MENTGFYTCPLDIIGNYWKHFQGLNLNKVSHHQKIDHSSQKHWILFVSVRLHWTPMENIFKVYPQAIHFFFFASCQCQIDHFHGKHWILFMAIGIHRTLIVRNFGAYLQPRHDFFLK